MPLVTGVFEVLSDHGDTEEDGEESSFFDSWDEHSDVLQQADLGTERTEVHTQCKSVHFCELPCLLCVTIVGCALPTVANYSSPL